MTKVDLLVENASVYNSYLRHFQKRNVSILNGKFYWIGQDLSGIEAKRVINLDGKYLVPGLVDSHMHIESSMTTPTEFGKAVAKFGTTTVIADAHEIANVAGIKGLKEYMDLPSLIDVFYAIPSSVPSTNPQLETTGGIIAEKEVEELLDDSKIICLGEAMNFKGLTSEPDSLIRKLIAICRKKRPTMPIEGHSPKYLGEDLAKFIYSGVTSDHTQQTVESLLEKVSNGMFIQIQRKSMSRDIIQAIIANNLFEHVALVTDDVMADDLRYGHLNELVKMAINFGMSPADAVYISSYTPARRMGLWDRGAIAPGRVADFIVLDTLDDFTINAVYKSGVAIKDFESESKIKNVFSNELSNSVQANKLGITDLEIVTDVKNGTITANVIRISEVGTFTSKEKVPMEVKNYQVQWQNAGVALLVIQERYGNSGELTFGFVKNAITHAGAIAATWAHDHHNLMVMGTKLKDMVVAQNKIIDEQGGFVVARNEEIVANVPLPIGGVVSEEPIEILGATLATVRNEMRILGYKNTNEIMSFSTLSLLVSPALKMSDKGLFDVKTQTRVPLFEKK